jgi:hypothetical protein
MCINVYKDTIIVSLSKTIIIQNLILNNVNRAKTNNYKISTLKN